MTATPSSVKPHGIALLLSWRRLRVTLIASVLLGLLISLGSVTPTSVWLARAVIVALCGTLGFGLAEQWPARLPTWLARWVLQLLAMVVAVPLGALLAYCGDNGRDSAVRGKPATRSTASASSRSRACCSRPGWRSARWCGSAMPGARPGAGLRARAQRARAPGAGRADATAAGAGRSRTSCSTRWPTCRRWWTRARRRPRRCSRAWSPTCARPCRA